MVSPPKPWERNGAVAAASTPIIPPSSSSASPATQQTMSSPSSSTPQVPDRPASFGGPTTSATSSALASSSMTSPYASPYSRMGSYGGMGSMGSMGSYGGMGSYGSYGSSYGGYSGMGYGSYGSGMGGMGGYGMGMGMGGYGAPGYGMGGYGGMGMMGPNGAPMLGPDGQPLQPTLGQQLESTTQNTFGLLHSIVQTFGGVAQMLESTFMATHSSFFAMVGVIEQFAHLRNALGSVLGLFGLMRWMKETLTGRAEGGQRLNHEFRDFMSGRPIPPAGSPPSQPRASKKPIIIFLLAIVGIPYAMTKLIRLLAEKAQREAQANGVVMPGQLPPLDPGSLTFARALYPFTASNANELTLKDNEIVAIVGKLDPRTGVEVDPRMDVGNESEWWKGRTRDGREGWFPRKWVEILERKEKKVD